MRIPSTRNEADSKYTKYTTASLAPSGRWSSSQSYPSNVIGPNLQAFNSAQPST